MQSFPGVHVPLGLRPARMKEKTPMDNPAIDVNRETRRPDETLLSDAIKLAAGSAFVGARS